MQQQGFNDRVLQGYTAFFDLFLPGPGRFQVGDNNTLTLVVSHGEILDPAVSTATAFVNDVPVHSWFLTPDTARQREITIPLPASRLKPNTKIVFATAQEFMAYHNSADIKSWAPDFVERARLGKKTTK
ncbi:MAG: hypothetical protein AAB289_10385 [Chloroflexota bacterium]